MRTKIMAFLKSIGAMFLIAYPFVIIMVLGGLIAPDDDLSNGPPCLWLMLISWAIGFVSQDKFWVSNNERPPHD